LLLLCLTPLAAAPRAVAASPPALSAGSAALVDLATGEVLYSLRADERKAPASTTKILTALVALQRGHLEDEVTIGAEPPRQAGTRVYLVEGETVTLEQLLYGMLVNSGNDAAVAIAEHYGGSLEEFAALMNAEARRAGAAHSHFTNPSGLSDPDHYTTARDLALIARAAMQYPVFREMVATRNWPWKSREWETTLVNHNRLLWKYQGADGVKNGYTNDARYTLVGSATRDGQTLIAVVLEEPTSKAADDDVMALLDYGFSEFTSQVVARQGQVMAVLQLEDHRVDLAAEKELAILARRDGSQGPTAQLHLANIPRPAREGTRVGEMVYRQNGKIVGRVGLVAVQPIPRRPLTLGDWWLILTLLGAAAAAALSVARRRRLARMRAARAARARLQ
jgi:D-alanyl-D-alanine carboxypeptidase (penicillin-binding protein 5/6)